MAESEEEVADLHRRLDVANQRILGLQSERDETNRILTARISQLKAAERKLALSLVAIRDFLSGDYPHPKSYRPDHCPHGAEYYSECARCDIEHFCQALAQVETPAETSTDVLP